MNIKFTLNGQETEVHAAPGKSLLDVLRELGLTSVKQGCGVGECGACSVLVDGQPIDSCLTLAAWADGKCVLTAEGLVKHDGELSPVQKAYVAVGAVQCGFCTPGLVMTTTAFVEKNKKRAKQVTREEIRKAHAGHLCRCTGYELIIAAVETALGQFPKSFCE